MKKSWLITLYTVILLTGCGNIGHIVSGQLVANNTNIDLAGKNIILNDDCSPNKVDFDIPYCGKNDINKGELCSINPDEQQLGYKIFQVINDKDALICKVNIYGGCVGEIEYVKNLGEGYELLADGYAIKDSILLKTGTYSYKTLFGKKLLLHMNL